MDPTSIYVQTCNFYNIGLYRKLNNYRMVSIEFHAAKFLGKVEFEVRYEIH